MSGSAEKETEMEGNYVLAMVPCLEEIMASDITERVRGIRFEAITEVQRYLRHYEELGYAPKLLVAIAKKKCELIATITSKKEMEELVRPQCPQYDGNKFVPGRYHIPEEELICWSQTSLKAPLNDAGFKRYMELFREVFPEESAQLAI